MAKVVVYEFMSLDGCFEGPEGHEMDFVNEGFLPEIEEHIATQYAQVAGFIMGGTTFRKLSEYWPTPAAAKERLVDYMNQIEKLVVARNADIGKWPNSTLVGENALEKLRVRRAGTSGDLMVIGSGTIATQLVDAGLVDELRMLTFPVYLRSGRPLFKPGEKALPVRQLEQFAFSNGVIERRFAPA